MADEEISIPLAFAIVEHLTKQARLVDAEASESLEVAIQCLTQVYAVNIYDGTQYDEYSIHPSSLAQIFKEYLETKKGSKKTSSPSSKPSSTPTPEQLKEAETYKMEGNELLKKGSNDAAIQCYTKAIELCDHSTYYCNRAAAYSALKKWDDAIQDCNKALELEPDYAKAHSRLGFAYFSLERYDEAIEAYKKALRFDPSNSGTQQNLRAAETKLKEKEEESNRRTSDSRASPNAAGFGGGAGAGGFDINSLLSNPNLLNMASSFMSSPMAGQLLNNPMFSNLAGLLSRGGGGGGGAGGNTATNDTNDDERNEQPAGATPDISQLLNNPDLMNTVQNLAQTNPDLINSLSGMFAGANNSVNSNNNNNNNSDNRDEGMD